VGNSPEEDEIYRLTYDGSVNDEPGCMAMGGQAEAISGVLRANYRPDMSLREAIRLAVQALGSVGGEGGAPRTIAANQLEVAILDRRRRGRTFRRITGAALTELLDQPPAQGAEAQDTSGPQPGPEKPTASAASTDTDDTEQDTGGEAGA